MIDGSLDYEVHYCPVHKKQIHYFKAHKAFKGRHCWDCSYEQEKTKKTSDIDVVEACQGMY